MKKIMLFSLFFAGCCLGALTISVFQSSAWAADSRNEPGVVRKNDVEVTETDWGTLQWLVTGAAGASEKMTLGRVTFKPGRGNNPHRHPNCEEILFVVQGTLEQSLPDGGTTILRPGDCIVLPQNITHNAKNIGDDEAVVVVCYNSAYREVVGE